MTGAPSAAGPLVSVIVPVYNAGRFIGRALASVLAQPHQSLDVIVVDDGSEDDSCEVVSRLNDARCRLVRQPNGGAASARNRGIQEATGAMLAFLDADDEWTADKLGPQVTALAADATLDMVFGHYVTVHADGASPSVPQPGYSLGTMLIRRQRFLDVGPLSSVWRVGEFLDWFARAEESGLRHQMLPDVALRRHVHGANMTGADRAALIDYARIVRAAARRRGHPGPQAGS